MGPHDLMTLGELCLRWISVPQLALAGGRQYTFWRSWHYQKVLEMGTENVCDIGRPAFYPDP